MNSAATITYTVTFTEEVLVPVIHIEQKRCSKCKLFKPVEAFNKDSYRPSGLANNCRDCYKLHYAKKWENSTYKSTGFTGHWSKHEGARMDVVQELSDVWYCQSCNARQPKDLTPYKYEYPQGEWIRVCGPCVAEECIIFRERLGIA